VLNLDNFLDASLDVELFNDFCKFPGLELGKTKDVFNVEEEKVR
jgi:hypothetical protein